MMTNKGLTKLIEECGELIQVVAKKIAYMNTDHHPDGTSMKLRLEDEIGDVLAAIDFSSQKLDLNLNSIYARHRLKYSIFRGWDQE